MEIDELRKNQKEVDRVCLEEAKRQILERHIPEAEETEKREGILRCFVWDIKYYEQALKLDEVKAAMAEKQVNCIRIEIAKPALVDILNKEMLDIKNGVAEWKGEFWDEDEDEGWD
jgi:hypothetical protein